MTWMETESLPFLDAINYVAPGFSYHKNSKAFKCAVTRDSFHLSGWILLEELEHVSFPQKSAFLQQTMTSRLHR